MVKRYCVYKHTTPCGKVYIGITGDTPQKRWGNGAKYKHNEHFTSAINKYGWDNIKHEILFDSLTKDEACQKEIELISEYKSNQREYGYNVSSGGECSASGARKTEQQRKAISERMKGKPRKGHTVSEETKRKISEANKGKISAKTIEMARLHNTGRPLSEETRRKISEANKGKKLSEEARRKLSIKHTGKRLSEETRKKLSYIQKGHKRNPLSQITKDKIGEKHSKRVLQYTRDGKFVCEYKSASEASRQLNISQGNISAVCRNERSNAGGFIWRYKTN